MGGFRQGNGGNRREEGRRASMGGNLVAARGKLGERKERKERLRIEIKYEEERKE